MDLNRRDFVAVVGAGLALAATAGADEPKKGVAPKPAAPPSAKELEVARTAAACVAAGELCVAHCGRELATGNTAMASCNARVHDMLATCRAMVTLASSASPLSRAMAAVCADACKACAAACLEHKAHWAHGMHLECKACYETCLACEKSCRELV